MTISSFSRACCQSMFVLALTSVTLWTGHTLGTTKDASVTPAELVKEALHREIYGLGSERDQLLSAAGKNADYGPAQWHRGFLRSGTEWVEIEKLTSEAQPELLKEYDARREACPDTVAGQLELANWCREKQLKAQERAHLSRVVELNPDHPAARERLEFRRVAGRWVTETEIARIVGRRKDEVEAAKRWRPELLEIGRDLQHSQLQRRDAARARLNSIREVHAIPTMESVLSVPSEEGALAVVDAIGKLKGQEAVESLVRHAVLSQSPLVRQAAAERLKERKWASFVPQMLREMYMPLVSRFNITQLRDGRIVYSHMFSREGQDEEHIVQLDTAYSRVRLPEGDGSDSLLRVFASSFSGLATRERDAAMQNALQLTYNQRLAEALRIATYQDLPADPRGWWDWWDKENDILRQNGKQARSQYQLQQVAVVDRANVNLSSLAGGRTGSARASAECFAAGTIVCTRYGNKPIETIRTGDLVLAQNIETGEIAFKPVLGRTLRPAEELVKVRIGKDEFECTHGHLFWVAGHGWLKAERLDSGVTVHCLRGGSLVSSVDTGLKAETYNLIVADFNTYFVGTQRVLSHDVTQSRPTDAVVPGLIDD